MTKPSNNNNNNNDLTILKTNTQVHSPTPHTPYHSVTAHTTHCRLSIRATKPFPDPLLAGASPDPDPEDWVAIRHDTRGECRCAHFALTKPSLFRAWCRVADDLRYRPGRPDVSGVFVVDADAGSGGGSYDVAEALGAAALVASMGLRIKFPGCFDELAVELGVKPRPAKSELGYVGGLGFLAAEEEEGEEEEEDDDADSDLAWFLIINDIR
ncbi:hypothetical protein F5X99DRAFT_404652 [Biscogniauxia marginata]|nr:hypothetical protein F5X99DRAFT_404652 [Biscogniauxia marginata]